ncbi:glycoside hydrolase family 43 protein [Xylariomycetidae sp. FL2044]|nr:glycoside hydrolase family 43 protein [Xylariomycetidae sp. FL2044]
MGAHWTLDRFLSFVDIAPDTMAMAYDNSTIALTSISTPDPFLTHWRGRFFLTFTAGNKIEIWSSRSLVNIEKSATRHVIWIPPPAGDHSADIWAPELHAVGGRWYVYYAAANPAHGNRSHRMYVLGGPKATDDPCQGQWEFLGRIEGMPDRWAIDGTIFELNSQLYFVYSGWPLDERHESDLVQQLFIMGMEDPTTASSQPVMISAPDNHWEITRDGNGDHGINEGPQFLSSPDGKWKGIGYSCAGSWTHEYKMATLQYMGGDPLDARTWMKSAAPLIQTKKQGSGPFGPGHGSFLDFGGQVISVYHATDSPTDGWENRRARVQRVAFTGNGPYMGKSFGPSIKSGLRSKLKAKLGHRKKPDPSGKEGLKAFLEGGRVTNGRDAANGNGNGTHEL